MKRITMRELQKYDDQLYKIYKHYTIEHNEKTEDIKKYPYEKIYYEISELIENNLGKEYILIDFDLYCIVDNLCCKFKNIFKTTYIKNNQMKEELEKQWLYERDKMLLNVKIGEIRE